MGKDIQLYKSVPFEMHDEQYLTKDYALELKNKGIDIEVGMGLDLDDKKSYKFFIDQLKKIKSTLDSCGVKAEDTRIHCPLGFKYEYWIDRPVPVEEVDSKFVDKYKPNKFKDKGGKEYYITNNYNFLKEVAENIFSLGFKGIVIHTPHGSSNVKEEEDFKNIKNNMKDLASLAKEYNKTLDVELLPSDEKTDPRTRSYTSRYSELLKGTGARPLLDTESTKGVPGMLEFYEKLQKDGLKVEAIHIQDLHRPISADDFKKIVDGGYKGTIVDEGFFKKGYYNTHDEMMEVIKDKEKTKAALLPKEDQIKILGDYKPLIKKEYQISLKPSDEHKKFLSKYEKLLEKH